MAVFVQSIEKTKEATPCIKYIVTEVPVTVKRITDGLTGKTVTKSNSPQLIRGVFVPKTEDGKGIPFESADGIIARTTFEKAKEKFEADLAKELETLKAAKKPIPKEFKYFSFQLEGIFIDKENPQMRRLEDGTEVKSSKYFWCDIE